MTTKQGAAPSEDAAPGGLWYAGGMAGVGGVEEVTATTILELRARGISIDVGCWSRGSRYVDDLTRAGVRIVRTRVTRGCRWGIPDRVLAMRLRPMIKSARCVVFAKLVPARVHEELRAMAPGARFILITSYRPGELAVGRSRTRTVQAILRTFDEVVVQADSFKADLLALGYTRRIHVIPLIPRDTGPTTERAPQGLLRVGHLGRLVPQKNLPRLLGAFALSRAEWAKQGIASELVLIGDGPERSRLEALAAELGLAGCTRFVGAVPPAAVDAEIDACDLFALTSRTEGQCLAAMEILRRGRPIVSTAVGALPDLLFQSSLGALVNSASDEAFAEALTERGSELWARPRSAREARRLFDTRYDRAAIVQAYASLLRGPGEC